MPVNNLTISKVVKPKANNPKVDKSKGAMINMSSIISVKDTKLVMVKSVIILFLSWTKICHAKSLVQKVDMKNLSNSKRCQAKM